MAANSEDSPRQRRSLRLWIGYWLGMFVVMHVPIVPRGAMAVQHGDKVTHFVLYFLLTWLGARYWRARGRRMSVGVLLGWAAVYTAYAAADEWLQQFVGRTTSMSDWVADVTGVVVATAILALRHR